MIKRLKKYLLPFIISYSVILRPVCVVASASTNTSRLQTLLNLHLDIKTGIGSFDLINKHGQKLLDQTSEFLAKQKNQNSPKSPDLIELEKHQKYLANYFELKRHLAKCVEDDNNKRQLGSRILESACQSMLSEATGSPCEDSLYHFRSLIDFNALAKVTKDKARPEFQDELTKQIMLNTAKSLAAFRYKFDPEFMKSGKLERTELDQFINQVCTSKGLKKTWVEISNFDVCQSLGQDFRQKLTKEILMQTNKLLISERKFTLEAATFSLNRSLVRLNENLRSIEMESDNKPFFRKALPDKKSQSEYNHYQMNYFDEVQKDAGVLLLTRTLKEKVGSLRNLSDDTIMYKNHSNFRFVLHRNVKIDDVQASIDEAQKKILGHLHSAQDMAKEKAYETSEAGQRKENIKDLAKLNPMAAGQVLIRNPEYVGIMCEAINAISHEDDRKKKVEDAFIVASVVGLAATGVGVAIGGPLLTSAYLAGGALSLATLGYEGNRSLEKYKETTLIESAYLSRNSDRRGFNEARESLIEFKDARFNALLSLGLMGLSGIGAGKFFNGFKSPKNVVTPQEMRESSEVMKTIDPAGAQRLKELEAAVGDSTLDQHLAWLAKQDEPVRNKFFQDLKDSNVPISDLKASITHEVASPTSGNRFVRFGQDISSKTKKSSFDSYEWGLKWKFKSDLKKQGKSDAVAAQEAENLAKVSRQSFQRKYEQCHAKKANSLQIETMKRFMGISLGLSFAGDIHGYYKANGDNFENNKLKWFSLLAYDLTMEFLFTRFNVKAIGSQSDSAFKKYIGVNIGDAKIGAGDAVIYTGIYGANEEQARLKISEVLSDPEARKELKILDAYIKKTNFVKLFEDHIVGVFRKIINSPDKENLLGKPPYDMGDRLFSNLTNEDLNSPEIRKALVRAALIQMNSGKLGALLSTGDKGLDRWSSDRLWSAGIGVPKGMATGLVIFQVLCLGMDYPVGSLGLASGIQFMNQYLSGENYYKFRMWMVGL